YDAVVSDSDKHVLPRLPEYLPDEGDEQFATMGLIAEDFFDQLHALREALDTDPDSAGEALRGTAQAVRDLRDACGLIAESLTEFAGVITTETTEPDDEETPPEAVELGATVSDALTA